MKKIEDEQIIDMLEGAPNPELEALMAKDEALQKRVEELQEILDAINQAGDVEVPSHIGLALKEAIANEQHHIGRSNRQGFSWMQIAAAVALLIVGFGVGKWSDNEPSSDEIALLRDEIRSLKQATLTNTLQRHSASERIMAVNRIEEEASINITLVATLVNTLNTDESPNVRYAALQALVKFIDNETVRAELIKSLETQTDPLIQISLITILVQAEEKGAITPLKDIVNDDQAVPEVKQQAQVALKVLT
ncbi:MAG: hypothetical protein Tsb0034_14480 [Ekhidna sp.]